MNDRMRDELTDLAVWYQRRMRACLQSWSGADKTDAELHRREADACLRLAKGEDLETVLADLESGWQEWATRRNQEIEAGARMRYGPSSGLAACHYMYADPNRGTYSACYIRSRYQDAKRRFAYFDEEIKA